VTLGQASQQPDLFDPVTRFCDDTVSPDSIYGFLHRRLGVLFPDVMFADLFSGKGRRSVPPSVVAVVMMVLQRLEGLSDREAVDRFSFDVRWRYAAGVGGWDGQGRISFAHTAAAGHDTQRGTTTPATPSRSSIGTTRRCVNSWWSVGGGRCARVPSWTVTTRREQPMRRGTWARVVGVPGALPPRQVEITYLWRANGPCQSRR
jgi:Transposase domain (DUF772)